MGTKVVKKGILKPLKYFSTVFDNNKEPEMQIGLPTDVKHVAHIGWDGPALTAPSWMNEYHSAPLAATGNPWGSQDSAPLSPNLSSSAAAAVNNPTDQPNTAAAAAPGSGRPRRRHQSDGTISTDSASRDATSEGGSTKRGRRKHKKEGASSEGQDIPGLPKHSHRRRAKGSGESGELVKSSKIKSSTTKTAQDEQSDDKNNVDVLSNSLNKTKVNEGDEF